MLTLAGGRRTRSKGTPATVTTVAERISRAKADVPYLENENYS